MRYYPILLLLIGLVINTIWQQGVLFVLLAVLLLWTNREEHMTNRKWWKHFTIFLFIALGTLPLLIGQTLNSTDDVVLQLTQSWAITNSSLSLFALIFLRCFNGYLSILLLTSITPPYKLLIDLRTSKLPRVITELIEMIYRFIYILIEKAEQVLTAQKSRLGYLKYNQRFAHSGMLLSRTLVLADKDSNILYDSMLARGLEEGDQEENIHSGTTLISPGLETPLLEIKGLSFYYEKKKSQVLQDLNLQLHKGEKIAIMGANGAGKSTLIRILSGLAKPQNGELYFAGQKLALSKSGMKRLRQNVGILFQNADLQLFCPTIWEEIAFGLRNLGFTGKELGQKVAKTLKDFGLEDIADFPPHKLSGGQKRWVTLAAVEAMSPHIILLDEPFTGLDGHYIERLRELLDRWSREGKTLAIITHDSNFAREWSSRVLLLCDKNIKLDSSPNEFFQHKEVLNNAHIPIPLAYLSAKKLSNSSYSLPIFLPTDKVNAIIIGGGLGAWRKAVSLERLGISFNIISPTIKTELAELVQTKHNIKYICRSYIYGDLRGYTLAILATGDPDAEEQMISECERYRVHYNCISVPELSTFHFGATGVEKGIEISIHTQYKVPHLGQILRDRTIEQILSPLDESKLKDLSEIRKQMVTSKKLGSIDYEALKRRYDSLKKEI